MKQISKRDHLVLQFVTAKLARMKKVGIDDGQFRGVSIDYRPDPDDSTRTLVMIVIPGQMKYHHEMVIFKCHGEWHPLKCWFCEGGSRQEV